jgi:hypothetical protein
VIATPAESALDCGAEEESVVAFLFNFEEFHDGPSKELIVVPAVQAPNRAPRRKKEAEDRRENAPARGLANSRPRDEATT